MVSTLKINAVRCLSDGQVKRFVLFMPVRLVVGRCRSAGGGGGFEGDEAGCLHCPSREGNAVRGGPNGE